MCLWCLVTLKTNGFLSLCPTHVSKLDSCLPICRPSSSKMLQTPFTSFLEDDHGGNQKRFFLCLLPSHFCEHGFIFKNKHKTDEDFVLLCKRTSSTCCQHSVNAVKVQCMHCERHESVVRVQIIASKNSLRSEKQNCTSNFSYFMPQGLFFAHAIHFETFALFYMIGFWIIFVPLLFLIQYGGSFCTASRCVLSEFR